MSKEWRFAAVFCCFRQLFTNKKFMLNYLRYKKMKRFTYFFTALLTAILCVVGSNEVKAATYNYNTVIQSIEVIQSDAITTNQFTLNITQKGVNSGGSSYSSTMTMVFESDDRTLEGLYSTLSNATNKLKSADLTYKNGTTTNVRALNTATSKFKINKVSDGHYNIGDPSSNTDCQLHFKQTSPSNSNSYNYFYSYRYDSGTSGTATTFNQFAFDFTPKYANAPTGVTASAVASTTATVSWTSSESAWQYVCLPASTTLTESLWTSNKVSTNSKSVNLTSLTPATTYKFYVISDRGANGTSVIASTQFTTSCAVISSLPWNYGFEDATNGQTPTCWVQVLSNASGWFRAISGASYRHTGSFAARLFGGTSTSTVTAVFPEFADDINGLAVSFWYNAKEDYYDEWYEENLVYGKPQFGYITDVDDASTFVAVGEPLAQSNTYIHAEDLTVSGAPVGARFALRYTGGTSTDYLCIDDITVDEKPACNKPTGVAVTADSETDEGATITWNANGMSAWQVQVSEGDAASWGESMAVATNSKVLTGLNANTLYYVRVRANCGDGEANKSEWSDNVSFTTLCGTVNVSATSSWNEDFQSFADNAVPDCWDNSASTTTSSWGAGYIWGTYSRLGNRMIGMDNAQLDGGTALINTPSIAIPNDGKTYELTFEYSNMALVGNNLSVKISANGGAFVEKGNYANMTGYTSSYPGELIPATISLADYSGKTIKIQFFANPASGTSSSDGAMFVDNVSVHKVPTCFPPTALVAGNLTANSARVTWTAGASETAWRLQYRADGGNWSAEQSVSTNAQYNITSLSANTLYYVRVKSYCDAEDQSEWSEVASFTTLCAAESMPFAEHFSSASELPSCWEATPASGTYKWGAYENSGAYSAQLRTGSSGEATLRMPPVSLSEDAILRFEWKNASGATVNIYVSIDGGSTKTMIPNDLSNVHSDWTTKVFDLSAYTGETALIYFVANFSTMNQYAYLDDVEVLARPCNMILNISAAPITGGGTLSWSGNVKKIRYKTGSAAWSYATIESASYAGPHTLSGLTPARSYQFCLLPACSDEEEANWTTPVFFTTKATEMIPYSNDFESETPGEVPFNWSRISSTGYPQVSHDAYAYKEGGSFGDQGNSIKFYGVNEQIIVLPEFDQALENLYISFHYRNRDCTMQLGYVEDDGSTFVALETLPNQTGYGEYPFEKDLYGISGDAANLAIRYSNAGASAQAWVDNVEVKEATCGQPTELTYDNVTANSVHISWSASARGGESNYQYIRQTWSEEDPDWASATLISSSVTELNITGLSANTNYEFYLRSYCGVSDQSTPIKIEFKTAMLEEVFEDVASATNNETRLAALVGQTINITINRPLLRNGDYCTLTLPFSLSASQLADANCPLRGFVIKEFESSRSEAGGVYIYLTQVTSIEAGKPYFVRYSGTPTEEQLSPLRFQNATISLSSPVEVDGDNCDLHGVFNPYNLIGGDESTLFLSAANTLYWPTANGIMKGFRAYIKVSEQSPLHGPIRRGAPIRIQEKEDTTTGMDNIQGDKAQSTKVLRNGQLYIMYNGTIYNIQGQVVK